MCKVGCECGCFVVSLPNHFYLFFHLTLDVFFTLLHIRLGLSHPLVLGVSHCICSQPLDLIGIHILCCIHGEKRMALHDVVHGAFVTIVKNARFHVL
jgi:hypothetical protein